jgi:hypothetical protein
VRRHTSTLITAFVDLAETLVGDFDTTETLHLLVNRCVEVLHAAAAGVMVTDDHNELRVVATSSDQAQLLALYQQLRDEGPCLDAYRDREPVHCPDLAAMGSRWPRFARAAQEAGFSSVHAVPMRLRDEVIGCLNLFGSAADPIDPHEAPRVGQALADIATIAVIQNRALRDREALVAQLQTALDTRLVIEQAKGIVAAHLGVDLERAFTILRSHARDNRRRLVDLATEVAHGQIQAHTLLERT